MWLNLFMLQGGWLPAWTHPTLTWIDPNGRTLEKRGPCPSTSTEKEKLKFYITSCSFCFCNSAWFLQSLDHAGHRKWGLTMLGTGAYLTYPYLALIIAQQERRWGLEHPNQNGSLMQWTWIWANFGRWWGTDRPGMLQSMELQSRTWLGNGKTTT